MRTHLEFRSSAFPADPGEEEEVNPGRHGKRLAEYLGTQLPKHGFATGQIYAEDWGWAVPIEHQAFNLWVGCGNYEEYPDGFLCFIEPSKPFVRRGLFKKVDTRADVERLANAIEFALKANADVHDLRWWTDTEVSGGTPSN